MSVLEVIDFFKPPWEVGRITRVYHEDTPPEGIHI
jgi:hypothetical protein